MEYQVKLNEKYMPVLHCISSFEGTSFKKLEPPVVLFLVVLHQLLHQQIFLQFFRTS